MRDVDIQKNTGMLSREFWSIVMKVVVYQFPMSRLFFCIYFIFYSLTEQREENQIKCCFYQQLELYKIQLSAGNVQTASVDMMFQVNNIPLQMYHWA